MHASNHNGSNDGSNVTLAREKHEIFELRQSIFATLGKNTTLSVRGVNYFWEVASSASICCFSSSFLSFL